MEVGAAALPPRCRRASAGSPEHGLSDIQACGQLQPGSSLLRQLLPTPPHVRYKPVVLASSGDGLVSPSSAFALPGEDQWLRGRPTPRARKLGPS